MGYFGWAMLDSAESELESSPLALDVDTLPYDI